VDYVVSHPEEYSWIKADKHNKTVFHTTEIRTALPTWERGRRFVIVRKTLPKKLETGQLVFDECRYEYQVIVTNIDYLSSAEIFNDYNQRCTAETSIDELKSGYGFGENSQTSHKSNELYMLIKMIAYNLNNWFKNQILPESERHHRITTIRRNIYHVCGILSGKGQYQHVKYQSNSKFEKIICYMQEALKKFCLHIRNG
jgi:hypothetical protein